MIDLSEIIKGHMFIQFFLMVLVNYITKIPSRHALEVAANP